MVNSKESIVFSWGCDDDVHRFCGEGSISGYLSFLQHQMLGAGK